MTSPDHLRYTDEHEWLDVHGDVATVGITGYAAQALGDVVYVGLPSAGDVLAAGAPCGEIESTKSVSDIYNPAAGRVVEVNDQVVAEPGLVNSDPFGTGWLYKIEMSELPETLDATEYLILTGEN
jgi:glycine cleavage system H protein